MIKKINNNRILRRKKRISGNLSGTFERPRIVVFRTNKYTTAQAIDDVKRITIVACTSQIFKKEKELKKTVAAKNVGIELAKKLIEKKINKAIFDRSVYAYKGRVKELVEGLREAGIKI